MNECLNGVPPDVGLAPSRLEGLASSPLRPKTPPPYQSGHIPSRSMAKRARGAGGGKREGEGWERRAVACGKGAPVAMGGWGTFQRAVAAGQTSGGS